ncbi:hypothetical protein O6H91_10G004700 [Diphasiastrum complanatum]|uniref:Uncharacterized protein n=1 Tax=Diphasiastrum complanatum TaxID=34168 RepID=A0ACC2CDT6_DIPCM|nr:hypothetical protein O6H91_10G004700 [Diphasiastrum complanatum]
MEGIKIREEKRISRKRMALKSASGAFHNLSKLRGAQPYQTKFESARQKARTQCSTKKNGPVGSLRCSGLVGSRMSKEVNDMQSKTSEGEQTFENQECRVGLEMDVKRLKEKLTHEINLHKALERAFHRPAGALPRVPHYLPAETQELIAEVAVLEEEIVSLEDKFFTLQQDLYNEAVCISAFKKQKQNPTIPKEFHLQEPSSYNSRTKKPSSTEHFLGQKDVVKKLLSSRKEILEIDSRKSAKLLENRSPSANSASGANKRTESSLGVMDKPGTPAAAIDMVVLSCSCKEAVMQPINGIKGNDQLQAAATVERLDSQPMRLEVGGSTGLSHHPAHMEKEDLLQSRIASSCSTAKKGEQAVSDKLCDKLSKCRISSSCLESNDELPSGLASQEVSSSGISPYDHRTGPNKLSEETMKCLLSIYFTMTRPYPISDSDALSSLSLSTFSSFSSQSYGSKSSASTKFTIGMSDEPNMPDPYGVCDTVPRDIGPYKQFQDITAASFDYGRIPDCASNLRRLREMVGKLAKVDLQYMSHHQKLAFWINIYNACMMHAFLEYGIPCSSHQVITLTHKAALNVGGYLLNVQTIERMLQLPARSNHTFTTSKETACIQSTLGLEWPEPQVIFALCSGSRSSPAVRVYTAAEVDDELELAKREYLQAAIGFTSKHKVLIPKLLEWNLSMFAKDAESLLDWLEQQLPKSLQVNMKEYLEKVNGVVSRVLEVMPYDFSFRYLLP